MLELGMATGDGVAEGVEGPPGEFIVWVIRKEPGSGATDQSLCGEKEPHRNTAAKQ